MKNCLAIPSLSLLLSSFLLASTASAIGTRFSYQGRLTDNGAPANAIYDLEFHLYNVDTAGTPIASTGVDDVTVVDGLFSVNLEFGNQFDGSDLWMETRVRPGASSGSFTALSPRRELLPAPHSVLAAGIDLPYSVTENQSSPLVDLNNSGSGAAFRAINSDPSSSAPAAVFVGGGFGGALRATQVGNGTAMSVDVNNAASGSSAVQFTHAGLGRVMDVFNTNSGNASPVIQSTTIGTNDAGRFDVSNPSNVQEAIDANTNGTGVALRGRASGGGRAGLFENTSTTSSVPALASTNKGNSSAGRFVTDKATNAVPALVGTSNGASGFGVLGETTGGGGTGVHARTTVSDGIALRVEGPIRMPTPGGGVPAPLFVHTAVAGNTVCSGICVTTLDHPLLNKNPNAVMFVLAQGTGSTTAPTADTSKVNGVIYDATTERWGIWFENTGSVDKFNVLVIQQ